MKKIRVSEELIYVLAVVILSFATAMLAAADLGMSMVVAPAYIMSLKINMLSFGQAEYIVQGMLFIFSCILIKKFRALYSFAFVSGIIYGAALDFWRTVIPHFNPGRFAPGTLSLSVRIFYFIAGFLLNSLGVALYFKTYFYPQVYEFFVKGVSERFKIALPKFKIRFDMTCLMIAVTLSFALSGRLIGIGAGTVILAFGNGPLIGLYGKWMDHHLDTWKRWKRAAEKFE